MPDSSVIRTTNRVARSRQVLETFSVAISVVGEREYVSLHVPRHLGGTDARQARTRDGRLRPHADLRSARRAQHPALAPPPRRGGSRGRRRGRAALRQHARDVRGLLGGAALGPLHHGGQPQPVRGGGVVHHRRLRREGPRGVGGQGRGGQRPGGRRADPPRLRRRDRGLRVVRRGAGRRVGRAAGRAAARRRPALLLRHHRAPEGHQAAVAVDRGRRARVRLPDGLRHALRLRRGHRLPLSGAGLPRRPAAVRRRHPHARRHAGDDGEVRAGGRAAGDRALPGDATRRWSRRCSCGCSSCPRTSGRRTT